MVSLPLSCWLDGESQLSKEPLHFRAIELYNARSKSTFLPSSSTAAFRAGEIGKSSESPFLPSEFNVQFEDEVVLHEMGNEPATDRQPEQSREGRDFNIMRGSGHIWWASRSPSHPI